MDKDNASDDVVKDVVRMWRQVTTENFLHSWDQKACELFHNMR
jgi:trans-2-enoyl-CoA reductase